MWLTRPLGYWETQLLHWIPPAPGRCTVNMTTHITTDTDHNIDPDLFRKAVLATVYNQPHLRADVSLAEGAAPRWVPATDFSQLVRFVG